MISGYSLPSSHFDVFLAAKGRAGEDLEVRGHVLEHDLTVFGVEVGLHGGTRVERKAGQYSRAPRPGLKSRAVTWAGSPRGTHSPQSARKARRIRASNAPLVIGSSGSRHCPGGRTATIPVDHGRAPGFAPGQLDPQGPDSPLADALGRDQEGHRQGIGGMPALPAQPGRPCPGLARNRLVEPRTGVLRLQPALDLGCAGSRGGSPPPSRRPQRFCRPQRRHRTP